MGQIFGRGFSLEELDEETKESLNLLGSCLMYVSCNFPEVELGMSFNSFQQLVFLKQVTVTPVLNLANFRDYIELYPEANLKVIFGNGKNKNGEWIEEAAAVAVANYFRHLGFNFEMVKGEKDLNITNKESKWSEFVSLVVNQRVAWSVKSVLKRPMVSKDKTNVDLDSFSTLDKMWKGVLESNSNKGLSDSLEHYEWDFQFGIVVTNLQVEKVTEWVNRWFEKTENTENFAVFVVPTVGKSPEQELEDYNRLRSHYKRVLNQMLCKLNN